MLPHQRAALAALDDCYLQFLSIQLGAEPRVLGEEFCQADCVLALLHAGHTRAAEALMGRPIIYCPPAMPPRYPRPVRREPRVGNNRRIKALRRRNPWKMPGARARYELLRVGMTIAEALARGVRRRDMRRNLRQGWVRVER